MNDDFRWAIVIASINDNIVRAEREIAEIKAKDPVLYSLISHYEGRAQASRLALAAICGVLNAQLDLSYNSPSEAVVAWAKEVWLEGRWAA